jgi:hypothetical protein
MKSKISLFFLSPVAGWAASTVLLVCSTACAGSGSWNVDADGAWGTDANWSPVAVPGTAAGDVVALTNNLTAARTVTLDGTSRTVGTLFVGDAATAFFGFSLAASGGAGLTFNNGGTPAFLVQTNSASSSDTVSAPLTLADNLIVTNRGTLAFSGGVAASRCPQSRFMHTYTFLSSRPLTRMAPPHLGQSLGAGRSQVVKSHLG